MDFQLFKDNLIKDIEMERDILVIAGRSKRKIEPLFAISNEVDKLYPRILARMEERVLYNVCKLFIELCKEKNISCKREYGNITIIHQGKDTIVSIINKKPEYKSDSMSKKIIRLQEEIGIPGIKVYLLKDNIDAREAIRKYSEAINNDGNTLYRCCLFEDFLEEVFGVEMKKAFHDAMIGFKDDLHNAIGYQITELCSSQSLKLFKESLKEELLLFDYDYIKREKFIKAQKDSSFARDLNDRSYSIIKETYLGKNRYQLMLGDSDFAESFITSEWLFKKYYAVDRLDNTFIVAGYLKSIEQLLWDIIYIVGQGRSIKGIPISEETEEDIDKTLGSLQHFMSNYSNEDIFQESFGYSTHFIMNYLKNQISNWRKKHRNGYFHKHNLKDVNKISEIRKETIFLYLLIFGSVNLTAEQMSQLNL